MANMIKNAIIKQLSKYLKNVSTNQINISTFKGEGEIKNIELDEIVLMDLLELPTWLSITSAKCTKASVKVPWTKLKNSPISIYLEHITIEMEATDNLRQYRDSNNSFSNLNSKEANSTSYGFIDKCIDGACLNVDSVKINFKSKSFHGTFDLSNICVYSTTPNWIRVQDIQLTRLKELDKGEILLFKEISWETCRIEAYSIDNDSLIGTPVKLIMNSSKAQITMKKKMSDKQLIKSKLKLLLNDLYWMVNDTQLKAALVAYTEIMKLIDLAFKQKTVNLKIQPDTFNSSNQSPSKQSQQSTKVGDSRSTTNSTPTTSKIFEAFDLIETSMHLNASTINIHFYCDDNFSTNKLIDGGTLQIILKDLSLDHYPYHKYNSSKIHWTNYNSYLFDSKQKWSNERFNNFLKEYQINLNKSSKLQLETERALSTSVSNYLIECCTCLTLKDLEIYTVNTNSKTKTSFKTSSSKQQQQKLNEFFIKSNYNEFNIPQETILLNLFMSDFYFLNNDTKLPVPSTQLFVQLSPLIISIDFITLLWLNTFLLVLYKQSTQVLVQETSLSSSSTLPNELPASLQVHNDIYIELLFVKVSLRNCKLDEEDNERPIGMNVLCSHLQVTNCGSFDSNVQESLSLTNEYEWPFEINDLNVQYRPLNRQYKVFKGDLNRDLLSKKAVNDVWLIKFNDIWIDFEYFNENLDKQILLESISFHIVICFPQKYRKSRQFNDDLAIETKLLRQRSSSEPPKHLPKTSIRPNPNISFIIGGLNEINLFVNHKQLLFLLRYLDEVSTFMDHVDNDMLTILGNQASNSSKLVSITGNLAIDSIHLYLNSTKRQSNKSRKMRSTTFCTNEIPPLKIDINKRLLKLYSLSSESRSRSQSIASSIRSNKICSEPEDGLRLSLESAKVFIQIIDKDFNVFGKIGSVDIKDPARSTKETYPLKKDTIKFRLYKGPSAENKFKGSFKSGFLELRLNHMQLLLYEETLNELMDFVKDDESNDVGLPLKIQIKNCKFIIRNDKLNLNDQMQLPKSQIPLNILIQYLLITRDLTNNIIVHNNSQSQLVKMIKVSDDKNLIDENDKLRQQLQQKNDYIKMLESERESLLKLIEKLDS